MASCPRLHPQRSFYRRAVLPCSSDGVAGGPFSFAAKEIRIGRGRPLLPWTLQAGHSSLLQRRLESDAEDRCRYDRCRRAIPHYCDDGAAVIRKSGPEIKNHCTLEDIFTQIHVVIPKLTP